MADLVPFLWVGPLLALSFLVLAWWSRRPLKEELVAGAVTWAFALSGVAAATLLSGHGAVSSSVPLGNWFVLGEYQNVWAAALDPLALTLALLSSVLIAIIAVFSRSYMHQESGYLRFYLLTCLFGFGVLMVAVAGTLDQLLFGWELVGLTSALLIAFFSHRVGPARNGLRAFISYRLGDLGLLAAVVLLHHSVGSTAISVPGPWLGLRAPESSAEATVVVLLLLLASAGKSALVPFSGWLPRAMEGPTPSSAVFYGALSINLGPFLLLRCWPLLEAAPLGRLAVVLVGLMTVVHSTLVGRVQSDAKSALAYGSMTQVGLVVVEIGLGLRWLAVAHMVGHACLRTLELLRAPSLLHDYHHLEQSLGEVLPRMGLHYERALPRWLQLWLYRHALERGSCEALLLWAGQAWNRMVGLLDQFDHAVERVLSGSQEEDSL